MSTILIIEDNPQSARLAEKLLKRGGHTVAVADTGEQGFIKASQSPPDLILIDLGLPDVDGQTIIGIMRQQPQLSEIPLIAFTAWPSETATEMAKAYGCTGVIIKPIDTKAFAQQVENFIQQKDVSDSKETVAESSESVPKPDDEVSSL